MNYNIERFLRAQEDSYERALSEIKNGRKETHWMWYIFPQLKALGQSPNAIYFGISDIHEAKEYLAHPVLGARLREICEVLLCLSTNDPFKVMCGIDGVKLCSSMTLFAEADGYDTVFGSVIDKYYGGKKDKNTLRVLYGDTF